MSNTKTPTSCSNLALIYLGLAIGAGIERHSFWVGLCVFFSLEFTALAVDAIVKDQVGQFYSLGGLGVGLGALAYVLAKYTPKMSWMGAYLILLGLAYVVSGLIVLSEKSLRSWLGFFVEAAGFSAISFAFGWVHAQAQLTWQASFATWNAWAYLLLFADMFVAIWVIAAASNETGGPYLFASFLSVAMVGEMAWITASKPAWMSITIWVLNGLAIVIGGGQLNKGYRKKGFVIPGMILGILSTILGILIPIRRTSPVSNSAESPVLLERHVDLLLGSRYQHLGCSVFGVLLYLHPALDSPGGRSAWIHPVAGLGGICRIGQPACDQCPPDL
jgi:hypothetical protein